MTPGYAGTGAAGGLDARGPAWLLACLFALALLVGATPADAGVINASSGVAIKGYDPVAYFEQERAMPGSPAYRYTWGGVVWRFASDDNRKKFIADPDKYAPQYGGYCAYAVAKGTTADVDPTVWSVVDGKLYLNQSEKVRKLWVRDILGYIEEADANWPKIRDKLAK
jgi:YHS domain-containing protein